MPLFQGLLNETCGHLVDAPHMVVFPALALMIAVLAFNLLGDAWRDWLEPRTWPQLAALELTR
jgi:peptide/nickel transport system permease protein